MNPLLPKMKKNIFIIFIPIILILSLLGSWQIYRYYEKTSYTQAIFDSIRENPRHITQDKLGIYDSIILKGSIDSKNVLRLYRRHPLAKSQDGAYLIVKFRSDDGVQLPVILGWVNQINIKQALQELNKDVNLQIKGLVLPGEAQSFFIPSNDYKKNICFTMNMDEINNFMDIKNNNYFIAALEFSLLGEIKLFPIITEMMVRIPNHHLEYASMWFCLAICACISLFMYNRK